MLRPRPNVLLNSKIYTIKRHRETVIEEVESIEVNTKPVQLATIFGIRLERRIQMVQRNVKLSNLTILASNRREKHFHELSNRDRDIPCNQALAHNLEHA
jgi:hypothetical protein